MNLEPVAGRLYRHKQLGQHECFVMHSGRRCLPGEIVLVTRQKSFVDEDTVYLLDARGVAEESSFTRAYGYGWDSWWEEAR
jgi:hypothetical protein